MTGGTMTVTEVRRALALMNPGRVNDLPTPMRSGTRVAIPFHDIGSEEDLVAYGTLRGSYGTGVDATALVELDNTLQVKDIPWSMLRRT